MLRCVVSSIAVSVRRRIIDGRGQVVDRRRNIEGRDTHEYAAAPAAAPSPTVPASATTPAPTTAAVPTAAMPTATAAVPVGASRRVWDSQQRDGSDQHRRARGRWRVGPKEPNGSKLQDLHLSSALIAAEVSRGGSLGDPRLALQAPATMP